MCCVTLRKYSDCQQTTRYIRLWLVILMISITVNFDSRPEIREMLTYERAKAKLNYVGYILYRANETS